MTALQQPPTPLDAVRKTATRLLKSSSKNSYDPDLDIDWDAPIPADKKFLPFERVSIYGTALWDSLDDAQRIELSRHELASVASTGLWFEIILIEMLARWAYHQDPQDPRTQYALTEIGDETRHVLMFAKAIERLGAPTYRPHVVIRQLARLYKAVAAGPALFAPVLVAEEITDRLQRETMNDEDVNPLVRMVNRIHVVEEARHVRFAREEVARQMQTLGLPARVLSNVVSAAVAAGVAASLISPQVYTSVGIAPRDGLRAARSNPNYAETRRWMAEKIMAFLDEQGMVTWYSRPIYKLVSLV
ncbi:diiron oxygenase [Jatrophihabitans endophyticus]|uniref:AurF N-oxygenase family protein n=1 Tax=Jatrophihabitans endophyticus TaxID=1206085 RepID=UPI001A0BD536|nr:diiron oxygenase [Jatrophihabitans endophyticus]MBE7188881.1 diiron oxygenase [Jatrophihabitans endophyticus]